MIKIKFNDIINIHYADGTIEKNIAVTGWMTSTFNIQSELDDRNIIKIERVESNGT